jgi:hypothetical protein
MKDIQQEIQKVLNDVVEKGWERGLQLAVYYKGELIVDTWAGIADYQTGKPVDGTTLFLVFSTTKGIAATIIHLLAEREKLDYDMEIRDVELGVKAISENNAAVKDRYFTEAKQTYALIQQKTAKLLTLPKGQGEGRDFRVTANMQASIGQIDFYAQKYAEAAAILKPIIQADLANELNRKIARYYLAAAMKQNQSDQPLYDQLMASDATELDKLTKLIQ